jgi:hypothetical protein
MPLALHLQLAGRERQRVPRRGEASECERAHHPLSLASRCSRNERGGTRFKYWSACASSASARM